LVQINRRNYLASEVQKTGYARSGKRNARNALVADYFLNLKDGDSEPLGTNAKCHYFVTGGDCCAHETILPRARSM
jgi:hypothetical protein